MDVHASSGVLFGAQSARCGLPSSFFPLICHVHAPIQRISSFPVQLPFATRDWYPPFIPRSLPIAQNHPGLCFLPSKFSVPGWFQFLPTMKRHPPYPDVLFIPLPPITFTTAVESWCPHLSSTAVIGIVLMHPLDSTTKHR